MKLLSLESFQMRERMAYFFEYIAVRIDANERMLLLVTKMICEVQCQLKKSLTLSVEEIIDLLLLLRMES